MDKDVLNAVIFILFMLFAFSINNGRGKGHKIRIWIGSILTGLGFGSLIGNLIFSNLTSIPLLASITFIILGICLWFIKTNIIKFTN
jgi:hypothetical protein